ncbi:hypothetical protein GCM10009557_95200 [Virgisporangium ochraceum]
MLDAVPAGPQPVDADAGGGQREPGEHGAQRRVADGVEAALQVLFGASDQVRGDLVRGQVAVAGGGRLVGVGLAQVGGA